jgi:hypothetical protein
MVGETPVSVSMRRPWHHERSLSITPRKAHWNQRGDVKLRTLLIRGAQSVIPSSRHLPERMITVAVLPSWFANLLRNLICNG